MVRTWNDAVLRAIIAILVLADGTIHLALDFVLFRGNFFGTPGPAPAPGRTGPPPGPRPGGPILPLNELFLLNFLGAIILVVLFLFADRWLGTRRWLMNLVLIAYEATTFIAWLSFGRPNPMGLGFLSKGIELIAIILLVVYTAILLRARREEAGRTPARAS